MGIFDWLKSKTGPLKRDNAPPNEDEGTPSTQVQPSKDIIQYSEALLKHSLPGWLLHTEPGEGEPRASRFRGRPYMAGDEVWPKCRDCDAHLSHLMQYDLETLSDTGFNHGEGLLRLFYCESEDCVGVGGWEAFDAQHHLSIIKGAGKIRDLPDGLETYPASYVTQWELIDDVPHWEDRPYDLRDEKAGPYYGHKFAGWPRWFQGPERPNCPKCDSEMGAIIQLDETHTKSFNFGGGIGHITQCKIHPEVLAFGWACG